VTMTTRPMTGRFDHDDDDDDDVDDVTMCSPRRRQ